MRFYCIIDKSNLNFTFPLNELGLGKYSLIYITFFIYPAIKLLNELLYPFHLTYNLSRLLLINFSIRNSF